MQILENRTAATEKAQSSTKERANFSKPTTYTEVQPTKSQSQILVPKFAPTQKSSQSPRPKSDYESSISSNAKDEIGRKGERAVYDKLCKKFGKDKVSWLSSNAKKEGEITQGKDNFGCDMFYIDENGAQIFVEVKASNSPKIEFYISKNELNFALSHAKNYQLYFVHLGENENTIYNLGTIFDFADGESLQKNSKFIAESESYKISNIDIKQAKKI